VDEPAGLSITEPQIAGFGPDGSRRYVTDAVRGSVTKRAITIRTIWPGTLHLDDLVAKANKHAADADARPGVCG